MAYFYLENYVKAKEYWELTYNVFVELDNKLGMAYCQNNLGMIMTNKLNDYNITAIYGSILPVVYSLILNEIGYYSTQFHPLDYCLYIYPSI